MNENIELDVAGLDTPKKLLLLGQEGATVAGEARVLTKCRDDGLVGKVDALGDDSGARRRLEESLVGSVEEGGGRARASEDEVDVEGDVGHQIALKENRETKRSGGSLGRTDHGDTGDDGELPRGLTSGSADGGGDEDGGAHGSTAQGGKGVLEEGGGGELEVSVVEAEGADVFAAGENRRRDEATLALESGGKSGAEVDAPRCVALRDVS